MDHTKFPELRYYESLSRAHDESDDDEESDEEDEDESDDDE